MKLMKKTWAERPMHWHWRHDYGDKLPCGYWRSCSAVENSVSGNAFRPMDIVPSRAGISVEIGNTDAEGRLILADALPRP